MALKYFCSYERAYYTLLSNGVFITEDINLRKFKNKNNKNVLKALNSKEPGLGKRRKPIRGLTDSYDLPRSNVEEQKTVELPEKLNPYSRKTKYTIFHKDIIQEYLEGSSLMELAYKYNMATASIKRLLERNSIPLRGKKQRSGWQSPILRKFDLNNANVVNFIIKQYREGFSIKNIAEKLYKNEESIKNVLIENNVYNVDNENKGLSNMLNYQEKLDLSHQSDNRLNDSVKKAILAEPWRNPTYFHTFFRVPVGKVVEFYIQNRIPFKPFYTRYVRKDLRKAYLDTNPFISSLNKKQKKELLTLILS